MLVIRANAGAAVFALHYSECCYIDSDPQLPRTRHMDSDTALSASSFSALYQFQGRIAPTTNKAWHGPFPESAVAPLDLRWKDYEMRKGFTRKPKADEPATQGKNYITPSGLQRLHDEHRFLLTRERPAVTEVVKWAASNGDRSENADYHYGKRRLRQIDGRIRFLRKRIEAAEVVEIGRAHV